MQLYAWSGQRSAAVRQYRECVRVLEQELGVPPLEETVSMIDAVTTGDVRAHAGRLSAEAGAAMTLYGPVEGAPRLDALRLPLAA